MISICWQRDYHRNQLYFLLCLVMIGGPAKSGGSGRTVARGLQVAHARSPLTRLIANRQTAAVPKTAQPSKLSALFTRPRSVTIELKQPIHRAGKSFMCLRKKVQATRKKAAQVCRSKSTRQKLYLKYR